MDILKKVFPFAFTPKKDLATLIILVIIYVVVGIVVGWALSLLHLIPFMGLIANLLSTLIGLYILATIVLTFLDYFKVLK